MLKGEGGAVTITGDSVGTTGTVVLKGDGVVAPDVGAFVGAGLCTAVGVETGVISIVGGSVGRGSGVVYGGKVSGGTGDTGTPLGGSVGGNGIPSGVGGGSGIAFG